MSAFSWGGVCRVLRLAAVALIVGAAAGADCGRAAPVLAQFESPARKDLSLQGTFDFIRENYTRKAYLNLWPYIDPAARRDVLTLLVGMDELQAADGAALKAVRRVWPDAPLDRLRVADVLTDNIEMFSREVQVVAVREQGDEGVVTILIAGEPPPVEVSFRRHEGRWVYVPGSGGETFIATIRELTKGLNRVATALTYAEQATAEDVAREYRTRVEPRLRQLTGSVEAPRPLAHR